MAADVNGGDCIKDRGILVLRFSSGWREMEETSGDGK